MYSIHIYIHLYMYSLHNPQNSHINPPRHVLGDACIHDRRTLSTMPQYSRVSPTDVPFGSWFLPGTNHFRLTILVRRK